MHSKPKSAQAVTLAEAQTTRALGHIHHHLGGFDLNDADAAALSVSLARQLSSLPDDSRRLLRRDIAVAAHELEGLVQALETELGLLADDLKSLNQRTGAARAYGQAASVIPLRRS
ncbi:hypothetical protein [Magnetospirillum sulfuroxidans]|uniref:Flagellar protein FliT n=1 Tax=Magnetospirillum sulfuroxidans TaxID=611300 RepID=A0ABS5IAK9_9PROT|nr:hypothetical protein [Magnetospirillum sulfuroxidans]MBR9971466.1 hypothetical protein [Magnetospirillum sulfuroxidans]